MCILNPGSVNRGLMYSCLFLQMPQSSDFTVCSISSSDSAQMNIKFYNNSFVRKLGNYTQDIDPSVNFYNIPFLHIHPLHIFQQSIDGVPFNYTMNFEIFEVIQIYRDLCLLQLTYQYVLTRLLMWLLLDGLATLDNNLVIVPHHNILCCCS